METATKIKLCGMMSPKDVITARDLGADYVVRGGQTMNPSAEDFLKAFETVNADHIFVLPSNSNIILAARQAAEIFDDSEIYVLESRTPGDGFAALSSLNYESGDPEEILQTLNDAMDSVETGMLTTAIRDTNINQVEIHNGDYIGFIGKEMLASDVDKLVVCDKILSHLGLNERFSLTVFTGVGADSETNEALQQKIAEAYPDVELYMIDGGQEVYEYIFVAE